eukprot:8795713-Ditylum_brightwellii.AAC.2
MATWQNVPVFWELYRSESTAQQLGLVQSAVNVMSHQLNLHHPIIMPNITCMLDSLTFAAAS